MDKSNNTLPDVMNYVSIKAIYLKIFFFILILVVFQKNAFGQTASASVLTKEGYFNNPVEYLSKINPKLVKSGILIDRTLFSDLMLNVDGKSRVTTISCVEWSNIYDNLKYASYDTDYISDIEHVKNIIKVFYEQPVKTYLIGILDFNFNKINQSAIDRGELIENDNYLEPKRVNANSFSTYRAVAASCLSHNIVGDNINFNVSSLVYNTNIKNQKLVSVEVDFGNGEGYKKVNLNEVVNVSYTPVSEYIQIKTKLMYEDLTTSAIETYYSHSSVFRTGSSTVPSSNVVSSDHAITNITPPNKSAVKELRYPVEAYRTEIICRNPPDNARVPIDDNDCQEVKVPIKKTLDIHIYFAPQNTSGKLRRPFILTDGFDPGNKRNFEETNIEITEELPKDRDKRGLFQLLNGDPSPWYAGKETSSNVIAALRADGYDLIFVDFIDGAGKIQDNVRELRGFFNKVLNSSKYRDNKTEEAILVGPSMGGVITRYMLTQMEQANPKEEHFIKTWISFDSPQQGANIPLYLQRIIEDLEEAVPKNKKGPLRASLDKLNLPAARQLLLFHYTTGNKPITENIRFYTATTEHTQLYKELGKLGYPEYSKNYGITNGGVTKLYPQDNAQIVLFSHKILGAKFFKRKAYASWLDNAPGGWNSALYTFNLDKSNAEKIAETDIPYTRATFIPTASAFGIKVTAYNVDKTWKDYKPNDTPFDEIRGMKGLNEEHVKISADTRNYLINDVLHPDFDNTTRPRVRSGKVLNQQVKGKTAFTSRQNTTFAGSGNSFTIESGADVVASAGGTIILSPGFMAKAGANFVAQIKSINYNTVLRTKSAESLATTYVDYTKPSPFKGNVYSYEDDNTLSSTALNAFGLAIYPNPLADFVTIELSGMEGEDAILEVFNSLGQKVYQTGGLKNGKNSINLSRLDIGIYVVKITYNGSKTKTSKIIKQ